MKKVTGIGGVFFKCKDPVATRAWYAEHLGLVTNEYGSLFEFRNADRPEEKNYLQWTTFSEKSQHFDGDFMVNYRVENLEALLEELKAAGVTIVDGIDEYEYGKFAHILDREGNKIELWEPVDSVFTREYEGETTK